MMRTSLLLLAIVGASASGGSTIKFNWKDCGNGAIAKLNKLSPNSLTLGQKTTVTGTGTFSAAVTGGTLSVTVKASILTKTYTGDICAPKTFDLPLGAGSLTWAGVKCPLAVGDVTVGVDILMSSHLPTSIGADISITAETTQGKPLLCLTLDTIPTGRRSELLSREDTEALGVVWRGNSSSTSSHLQLAAPATYPAKFSWCDKDGKSYCTMSRNQHIPQYCGSCWAHGAVSALGDRVKIARNAQGVDINLAVQHVLNCGNVGSCHGGSVDGTYQWLHKVSKETGSGISYETANPYLACSSESKEGFCPHADWTCTPANVARTCGSFGQEGGSCKGLSNYPNVTISEYGSVSGKTAMQKEIFNRGPIACGIDAGPLLNFETGIARNISDSTDHVVSVVGWGDGYWIVRNSWGEYWGDMGYVKVAFGALNLEDQCSWAVVDTYTAIENNNQVHCHEGGDNCKASASKASVTQVVV